MSFFMCTEISKKARKLLDYNHTLVSSEDNYAS